MAVEELNIRGLTGVGLTLRVAGPGTRAYAFLIDWHIRVLVMLAWLLVGLLVQRLGYISTGRQFAITFGLAFGLPGLLFYLLYHPVVEVVMRGRTPGKRMAGARLVTLEGATPGTGALLIRNVFRLIDQLPGLYLIGLVCCMFTPQRVRFGDLAAGTVLVLDEQKATQSLGLMGTLAQNSRLAPDAAALVRELLDRWTEMDAGQPEVLARALLVRLDPQLDGLHLKTLDGYALRAKLEGLLASK
jgi:uncharacterized RDD family membrane protein YckC